MKWSFITIMLTAVILISFSNAQEITGSLTAINNYQVWLGNEEGVFENLRPITQQFNLSKSQIIKGEIFSFDYVPQCSIYITVWSNNTDHRGIAGSFSGGIRLNTGSHKIQALPTNKRIANNQFPTVTEINAAIKDGQWVLPTTGPQVTDDPKPLNAYKSLNVPGLDPKAKWIGHGQSTWSNTGENHNNELLILRIFCNDLMDPDLVRLLNLDREILHPNAALRRIPTTSPE